MSAIDKTYIDGKEYQLYRQWWIDNYDKMIKELGEPIWLYTFSSFDLYRTEAVTPEFLLNNNKDLEEYKYIHDFPIWNTSESTDKWLVKNCNIQSFRNRMMEIYPINWSGFKHQKWVKKPNKKSKYINKSKR